MDRRHELRVKLASLAAEQRIIARTIRQLTARRRRERARFHLWDGMPADRRAVIEAHRRNNTPRPLCALNTNAINSLTQHAQRVVGPEARATHLASCLLRGTPYATAEVTTRTVPNLKKIGEIARRFGEPGAATEAAIIAWTRAACEYLLRPEARDAWSLSGMPRHKWDANVRRAARNADVPIAEPVKAAEAIPAR